MSEKSNPAQQIAKALPSSQAASHLGPVDEEDHASLFPATTSTRDHHIRTALPLSAEFLESELCAKRLHQIARFLWLAGRPLPPRPLHQQLLLSRKIVAAEAIELHLVWKRGCIFVKPLPSYLLQPQILSVDMEKDERLARCARGLVYSYTSLIRFESDFHIAQAHRLLPSHMTWPAWHQCAHQFLSQYPHNSVYSEIDARYWYGELRLGRLNKIYRFLPDSLTDVLYGYSRLTAHTHKADLFSDNLRTIAAALAYLVIVLQAMQVGLATDRLAEDRDFQRACYGFSIFSVIAPLAAVVAVLGVFLFLLIVNVIRSLVFERARFIDMHIVPPRRQKRRKKLKQEA